jgi:hypothetical protein
MHQGESRPYQYVEVLKHVEEKLFSKSGCNWLLLLLDITLKWTYTKEFSSQILTIVTEHGCQGNKFVVLAI